MRIGLPRVLVCLPLFACLPAAQDPEPLCPSAAYQAIAGPDFFADISAASGIQQGNFDPAPAITTPINDHSLVAFADLDGDGWDDIIANNLWANPCYGEKQQEVLVFFNNGDRTFTDFTDASGLRNAQAGMKLFGDVDNDGDLDMFAGYPFDSTPGLCDYPNTTHGNSLWLNDGAGHFSLKEASGIERTPQAVFAGSALFADFNRDGNLDLYIAKGHTLEPKRDELYFGVGDGTFVDALENLEGNSLTISNGSVACDYDNDGDQDIFVATYGVSYKYGHNLLWENDGMGHFKNVAKERGFAYQKTGNYWLPSTGYGLNIEPISGDNYIGSNGFGVACSDVNNDGNLDILLTAISHPGESDKTRKWSDPTQLLINSGPEGGHTFVNEFLARKLPYNEGDVDGDLIDFDNDGRLDISLSRDIKYEGPYPRFNQKGWFGLMRQLPEGYFESLGEQSGINAVEVRDTVFKRMKGAQNHAWSDIDRDGDVDLLVGGRKTEEIPSVGRPNFLFENTIGAQNAWLAVSLEGDGKAINRDAIGGRVTLELTDGKMVREVQASRGLWNAADGHVLHFGLADVGCVVKMEVRWPDGTVSTFAASNLPLNRYVTVRYGGILTVDPPKPALGHAAAP